MGSFQCLKMFVRHSPSSMICRDAFQLTPSNYASKNKKIECWKLLIASQFIHTRINGFSLASHARIMKWCSAAKERVSYFKGEGAKHSLLLHSTIGKHNTYLGNEITVSGFNHGRPFPNMKLKNLIISDYNESSTKNESNIANNDDIKLIHNADHLRQKHIDTARKSKKLPNISSSPQPDLSVKKREKQATLTTNCINVKNKNQPNRKASRKQVQDKITYDYKTISGRSCLTSTHQSTTSSIASFQTQEEKRVQNLIVEATSKTSKELADDCLKLGETFSSKPWMKQFDIAIKSSTNRIKRGRPRSSVPNYHENIDVEVR